MQTALVLTSKQLPTQKLTSEHAQRRPVVVVGVVVVLDSTTTTKHIRQDVSFHVANLLVNKGTMGVNSLLKTVIRRRRGCDLNPDPSAPESSTLTTRLPSHPKSASKKTIFI